LCVQYVNTYLVGALVLFGLQRFKHFNFFKLKNPLFVLKMTEHPCSWWWGA